MTDREKIRDSKFTGYENWDNIRYMLDSRIRSAHMLGSIEALEILKRLDDDLARADIHMIGVVAEMIDKGEGLTPTVSESILPAADEIERLLEEGGTR